MQPLVAFSRLNYCRVQMDPRVLVAIGC